jgi:Ferritin-like domain
MSGWAPHDTRRGFIRGLLAGSAALTATAVAPGQAVAAVRGGAARDSEVLVTLAAVEQVAAFSYRYVIGAARLSPTTASTLRRFLTHELVHVQTLAAALSRLGHAPPAAPKSAVVVDHRLAALGVTEPLGHVHLERQALSLLIGVETAEENAYHRAIGELSSPALVRLAAESVTCDAQHWTALSELAHDGDVLGAVPHALAPVVQGL